MNWLIWRRNRMVLPAIKDMHIASIGTPIIQANSALKSSMQRQARIFFTMVPFLLFMQRSGKTAKTRMV